jgi:hypothetical protein
MKAAIVNYPFELVAPMTAIGSVLLLPLGPLLIPRTYIVFLLLYFTVFLYTQVNHVFKFYLTATKMISTIRNWNQRSENTTTADTNTAPASPTTTTTRERITSVDELEDMETALNTTYDDSHFIHAFIVPNYAEPEALLRDTIKRLANHK